MRKLLLPLVLVVLAGGYFWILPPAAAVAPAAAESMRPAVRGAIHVHTRRSDGTGTIDDVAAAAERAGLDFVILTDHGNGTTAPEPPNYHGRVLVIDGVEVSTTAGHLVALGLERAPYPLAGEPRDVAEDVNRLGGLTIAAHPESAKPELQFGAWDAALGGIEWLNADSEWRDESAFQLLGSLLTYPARRPESIAALFDRPVRELARWDDLLKARRRITGVAAADAHARIGLRTLGEPYDTRVTLRIPSYESMFRTFSLALPDLQLTRDATADAAAVLAAIRRGQLYSRIDAVMQGGAFAFTARSGGNVATPGGSLALDGPVTLRIDAVAPETAVVVIIRDGVEVRRSDGSPIEEVVPPIPAAYRVELRMSGAPGEPPIPWLVSNPIYVGWPEPLPAALGSPAPATTNEVLYRDAPSTTARVEQSPDSQGAIDIVPEVEGRQLLFRYAVGGKLSDSPYVALTLPVQDVGRFTRVSFTARADHPTRVAVQLRVPGGPLGERWRRSIYLDESVKTITINFSDMTSVTTGLREQPPLERIDSLLFVADAVNTPLGGSGTIWLRDIRFER